MNRWKNTQTAFNIVSGMDRSELKRLADLLVKRDDERADDLCSYLETYLHDKMVSEREDQADIVRGDETRWM